MENKQGRMQASSTCTVEKVKPGEKDQWGHDHDYNCYERRIPCACSRPEAEADSRPFYCALVEEAGDAVFETGKAIGCSVVWIGRKTWENIPNPGDVVADGFAALADKLQGPRPFKAQTTTTSRPTTTEDPLTNLRHISSTLASMLR